MSVVNHGLGRRYAEDERDLQYRAVVPTVPLVDRFHWSPVVLNQGSFPHCVVYSLAHAVIAGPRTRPSFLRELMSTNYGLFDLYDEAQKIDEWDGPPPPYDGTSIRAGCKVLQRLGYVQTYRWSWNAEEIASLLVSHGPVLIGSHWMTGMDWADERGFIRPTGNSRGGHAYLCIGYSTAREAVRILNSWGRGFGENGRAWLKFDDLQFLLDRQGEGCLIEEPPK